MSHFFITFTSEMKKMLILTFLLSLSAFGAVAQESKITVQGYLVPVCVYEGDTIPNITLPTVYVFEQLKFKNKKQRQKYDRLVRNVKKTLPIAKEVNRAIIETYEYLQTLPNEKARQEHLRRVEKGVKEQYTPRLKKLTFSQGKLLIKLINRETDSSSYELVKAFLGPFKAGFYQAFAAIFGASLKKEYHPEAKELLPKCENLLICSIKYYVFYSTIISYAFHHFNSFVYNI